MTERGLPIVDGAPACPFVAFDDDRDERAASPDHRHRCYAEADPAPRALAHQEAYCLSSAFPVCPTFQDWARREAARSRTEAARDREAPEEGTAPPQRNPPRNWAAPPPWSSRNAAGQPEDPEWDDEEAEPAPVAAPPELPRRGRGLSGSYADRVAVERPRVPGLDDEEVQPAAAWSREATPEPLPSRVASPATRAADPWDDDEEDEPASPPPVRRRERDPDRLAAFGDGPARPRVSTGDPPHRAGQGGNAGDRRPDRRRENAPEWERARPLEAYPTLRSRRMPELSIPPILVAVVALALAAAVLFALPGLLGFGKPSAGGSPTPGTPVRTPIVTAAPTAVPAPTPQLYVVQPGDTMSKIAGRFGLGLGDLIAANAENIPDPNALQIGDQVIIPVPPAPSELPAASEIPAAP